MALPPKHSFYKKIKIDNIKRDTEVSFAKMRWGEMYEESNKKYV